MTYLFVGIDALSKEHALAQLKATLPAASIEFNYDCLYGKEITRTLLQEKLGFMPVNSPKRLLVIKDAAALKDEVKEYLREYVKKRSPAMVLVLDYDEVDRKDAFIADIGQYVKRMGFKETQRIDTFYLSRQVAAGKPAQALALLHQLLLAGEKPERIMGGLRYAWEKSPASPKEQQKKFALLLACDIDVKTGRLKPELALERLVIALSSFGNPATKA